MDQPPVNIPATPSLSAGTTFTEACFASGTMIATPTGEVAVETLNIGDLVMTVDGTAVPVRWLGVLSRPTAITNGSCAVRISAGALGDGLPNADLTVTGGHGMIVDGLVVDAAALVNGTTITIRPLSEIDNRTTYSHVETEAHDVIIANGALSETFIDVTDRRAFNNYDEYVALYGIERIIPEMDRPRIYAQRMLPARIKARLGISDAIEDFDAVPASA